MRGQYVAIFSAVILLTSCASEDKPPRTSDLDLFQGRWSEVSYQHSGESPPPEHFDGLVTVFDGGTFVRLAKGKEVNRGEISLPGEGDPKKFDGKGNGPGGEVMPYKGIYKFEGDRLFLCFDPTGAKRPVAFESPPDSGLVLTVFERLED